MTAGRAKARIDLCRIGIFDLRYIFANFAPQFPYKLRRGVVVDGGFSLTQG